MCGERWGSPYRVSFIDEIVLVSRHWRYRLSQMNWQWHTLMEFAAILVDHYAHWL
jgi:hypothetical protein